MKAFSANTTYQWPLKHFDRSKHDIFRDKERRRERIRSNVVARIRRSFRGETGMMSSLSAQ
jgi:hypothetical protein